MVSSAKAQRQPLTPLGQRLTHCLGLGLAGDLHQLIQQFFDILVLNIERHGYIIKTNPLFRNYSLITSC